MLVHTVAATEQDRHTYASSKPVSSVAFRVIAAESAAVEKQQTIHVAITHYWNVRHVWCQSSRRNASRQTVRCRVIDNFWGAFYCSSMANSTLNQSWMIHHDLQHTDKDGQIGNRWRTVAFTVTNWDQRPYPSGSFGWSGHHPSKWTVLLTEHSLPSLLTQFRSLWRQNYHSCLTTLRRFINFVLLLLLESCIYPLG